MTHPLTTPAEESGGAEVRYTHPRALAPSNLILVILLSIFGAIVGIQMLASLGITPSTSLIGALAAMSLSRLPLRLFKGFRSIHVQNLAQTSISSATFGAANSLFLPIGIPWLFGLPEMVAPMLVGISLAMLLDGWLLYRMYDTPAFPASNPWPPGVAAAEAIRAGDKGGKQAWTLLVGLLTGAAGALLHLPMSAFGVALIGGFGAMAAFGVGLVIRGYSEAWFGLNISAMYLPHGMMIGAGLVALFQVSRIIFRQGSPRRSSTTAADKDSARLSKAMRLGALGYLGIMILLCIGTGLYTQMTPTMLLCFVLYGAFVAFVHELIVGIAAMHSGWFPAFAVALITLLIGMLLGFPPVALVVLAGFSTATGPAFADMGFDLKTGTILRAGEGEAFDLAGRKEQLIAAMIGFAVAIVVVALSYHLYFSRGEFAPINAAYVATIKAGISTDVAWKLVMWAIPGAILQFIGGSRQQLGVLFATGLLIASPLAGWLVLSGILVRMLVNRFVAPARRKGLEVFAGGVIAGDALLSFFSSAIGALRK
ncbi:OPT/YSL family transporter [Dryocola clanedunensis]|uniref:OPT/YSL family transporter n=1 Tax=Cedecea sulfonylureivorans TaxID=3051154 RepID=UPI0019257A7C|nr:OPT/YSL family transporter [Cedecea sulfonylureivorans]